MDERVCALQGRQGPPQRGEGTGDCAVVLEPPQSGLLRQLNLGPRPAAPDGRQETKDRGCDAFDARARGPFVAAAAGLVRAARLELADGPLGDELELVALSPAKRELPILGAGGRPFAELEEGGVVVEPVPYAGAGDVDGRQVALSRSFGLDRGQAARALQPPALGRRSADAQGREHAGVQPSQRPGDVGDADGCFVGGVELTRGLVVQADDFVKSGVFTKRQRNKAAQQLVGERDVEGAGSQRLEHEAQLDGGLAPIFQPALVGTMVDFPALPLFVAEGGVERLGAAQRLDGPDDEQVPLPLEQEVRRRTAFVGEGACDRGGELELVPTSRGNLRPQRRQLHEVGLCAHPSEGRRGECQRAGEVVVVARPRLLPHDVADRLPPFLGA